MKRAFALLALVAAPAALADHTGDKWEGTWRASSGAFASTVVLRPATNAATRGQAPPCTGKGRTVYAGAYSGKRTGTIAACADGRFALSGRLYEDGARIGEFSLVWELTVAPDGTVGAPTFRGSYSAGGSAGKWSGTWLRHGGSVPKPTKPTGGAPTTAEQAADLVEAILRKNRAKCEMTWSKIVARRVGSRWSVTASVTTFGHPGQAMWNIVGTRVTPAEPLAADIENGCP